MAKAGTLVTVVPTAVMSRAIFPKLIIGVRLSLISLMIDSRIWFNFTNFYVLVNVFLVFVDDDESISYVGCIPDKQNWPIHQVLPDWILTHLGPGAI